MERHLEKDADRPSRKSKKEVAKVLDNAALALASGEQDPVVSVVDDNPGEKKRLWAVFPVMVPPKKADAPAAIDPAKSGKKSATKGDARPAAQKARRRSEQSLS
ncbi:MAG: hypothetical protein ABJC13_23965 [Acidobacteriota bacterium]